MKAKEAEYNSKVLKGEYFKLHISKVAAAIPGITPSESGYKLLSKLFAGLSEPTHWSLTDSPTTRRSDRETCTGLAWAQTRVRSF